MKKSVREWMQDRRVAAALAALAVLIVGYRLYPGRDGRSPGSPPSLAPATVQPSGIPAPAPAAAPPPAEAGTAERPARPAAEIAWSWGRNPFLPRWREGGGGETAAAAGIGAPAAAEVPQGLRGTVISGHSGIAVFGNRLVPQGGSIGEWTVERVGPYGVALRRGKEVRVVELFKPARSGGKGKGGDR